MSQQQDSSGAGPVDIYMIKRKYENIRSIGRFKILTVCTDVLQSLVQVGGSELVSRNRGVKV